MTRIQSIYVYIKINTYIYIYTLIYRLYERYAQHVVHGEGTCLSMVGPLDKPSSRSCFVYRFRVGPYRFCSDGNPRTLSILLWSCLLFSNTHIYYNIYATFNQYIYIYTIKHTSHKYTCITSFLYRTLQSEEPCYPSYP